ncbi:MAG: hypothetical protein ACKO5E_17295, partial [bacterium]
MDISVRFPSAGKIEVYSDFLFGDLGNSRAREFVERAMRADTVLGVTVRGRDLRGKNARAEITFDARKFSRDQVAAQIIQQLTTPQHQAAPAQTQQTLAGHHEIGHAHAT